MQYRPSRKVYGRESGLDRDLNGRANSVAIELLKKATLLLWLSYLNPIIGPISNDDAAVMVNANSPGPAQLSFAIALAPEDDYGSLIDQVLVGSAARFFRIRTAIDDEANLTA